MLHEAKLLLIAKGKVEVSKDLDNCLQQDVW